MIPWNNFWLSSCVLRRITELLHIPYTYLYVYTIISSLPRFFYKSICLNTKGNHGGFISTLPIEWCGCIVWVQLECVPARARSLLIDLFCLRIETLLDKITFQFTDSYMALPKDSFF